MFPAIQLEVMRRFTAVKEHFRASRGFTGEPGQISKGLVFVEIYAIYEFTVTNIVKGTTDGLAAHAYTYDALRPSLLALFLDPQLQSLRMCGVNLAHPGDTIQRTSAGRWQSVGANFQGVRSHT